ncbi:UNVERIFIED_CONTAM: hypothetical protein RMT77_000121 [Armadillidium vulgare]
MTSGFSFGTPATSTSGGFSFSAPSTSSTTPSTGFSFLTPTSSTATTPSSTTSAFKLPGFSLPTTSTASSGTGFPNFSLGAPATTASASSSAPTLFSTSTTSTTPATPGFSFGLNVSKPPLLAPTIGSSVTANSSFSFTGTTAAASTGGSTISTSSSFGPVATLSTATSTSSFGTIGAGGATNLSMRQLEERLNKWLVELKEQEERFLRQAAHVNAWDQILQNGHEQVQSLKDTLHTVKSDQSRLEAEIDFIRGQQDELERLLEPLESATNANPATQLHQGDRQRDNMYYLAQSLDAQLRQMTDDLGKVIEHLNTNSGSMQPNDPVNLVARILSAHMDTLKWVDQNTTLLSQKMEDVARVSGSIGKRG